MKRKTITLLTILISLSLNTIGQNFPREDVYLLLGKELIVKEQHFKQYGYDGFYKDKNLKNKYACCQSYNSKYDALVNKHFKVLSYESYIDNIKNNKFIIKITNEEIGILYFDYDPRFEHTFNFEVIGGINFPEGYFCKDITENKDKFTNRQSYMSPVNEKIIFSKVKYDGEILYFMSIQIYNKSLSINEKGLYILLDNNEKLEFPDNEIKVEIDKSGYKYSTSIILNKVIIEKLINNLITDVRLYYYDKTIENDDALIFKEYLKCLINK